MTTTRILRDTLNLLMAVGLLATGVFMIALFGAGFKLIAYAIGVFFGIVAPSASSADVASLALVGVLQGLEYLFVAPLAFLLFRTFIPYIKSFNHGGDRATADQEIRRIKILIISLVISALATDLVSKILGPTAAALTAAAPGLLAIVVFSGYLVVLQRPH